MQINSTLIKLCRIFAMGAMTPLDRVLRTTGQKNVPCCFIVGPPRSGTTVIYDAIVRKYKFSYISNLAHRFYLTPLAASWLGKKVIDSWVQREVSFCENKYGHINGWGAPNEGGWVWNRWFPESFYLDATDVDRLPVEEIRSTICGLSEIMGGYPFINKNVMHSVHLKLLNALFPNCLFVHVIRDLKDNARAIYKARIDPSVTNRDGGWFSVKPKAWKKYLNSSPLKQSVAQVIHLHNDISQAKDLIGRKRFLTVKYEDFCCNHEKSLSDFLDFFENNVGRLEERNIKVPVPHKPVCRELAGEFEMKLENYIASFS